MNLQPQRGDDKVAIPVTFDVKYSVLNFKMSKLYISLAAMVLMFVLWVIVMFIAADNKYRVTASVIAFIIVPMVCRMAIIGEYKYRKNYKQLVAHEFQYDYSLFWSIYDTSTGAPTVFHHTSGLSSVFVAFDKDVIVGKGNSSDYEHFEAIGNAYQLLAKKGINCIHIDYMDNVGKDTRLQSLFESAESCKSVDLRNCILDMLDYMQWYMMGTYADYDVYCFSSKLRPDLFIDELVPILSAFEHGNYIRYRILTRPEVRDLVASVFSIPDFSVTRTCDNLFASKSTSSYIKIIWTEVDGKREIVNKTREQLAAEARINAEEREALKQLKKRKGTASAVSVDLFDDDDTIEEEQEPEDNNPFNALEAQRQAVAPSGVFVGRTAVSPQLQKAPEQEMISSGKLAEPLLNMTQLGSEASNEEFDLFEDE